MDQEPSPIPLDPDSARWLQAHADAEFGGDLGAAAAAVIKAARLAAEPAQEPYLLLPADRWVEVEDKLKRRRQ